MKDTISTIYKITYQKLNSLYPVEEARAMADRLFEHFFSLSPANRILEGHSLADAGNIIRLDLAVDLLLNHVPLQYVTGTAHFMDMEFHVNSNVLIPRPETEEIVSLILKELSFKIINKDFRILDIGTGSGCIAISLKHHFPASEVTAVDISVEAIEVARNNAIKNKVEIDFIEADILDLNQLAFASEYDLIVSNPPYVTQSEKLQILPNVVDYEPHTALFVPDDDPLIFYNAILKFAKTYLRTNGSLWFEINEMFGVQLKNLAFSHGFREANIIFDFRGNSRFLQCSK
jgi:release factor glutamine methyltransferase